jgi:hypothetical protein
MEGVTPLAVLLVIPGAALTSNVYLGGITPNPNAEIDIVGAALSNDASLVSVAGQTITTTGTHAGTEIDPLIASITVPSSKTSITYDDIAMAAGASIGLYDSTFQAYAPVPFPLNTGENHLYIGVMAENGTTGLCYNVTVTRETAAPAPVISNLVVSVTGTNVWVDFDLSADATVYRKYQLSTEPAPTVDEIKAFDVGSARSAGSQYSLLVTQSLLPSTAYRWYMVAENADGVSAVVSADFTTVASNPPTVTSIITNLTATTMSYTQTLDADARVYLRILRSTDSAPSASDLKGGAYRDLTAGTSDVFSISPLSPNTTYVLYFLASNAGGDSLLQTVSFTTGSLSSDASLASVAGQTITTTGGAGAYNNPYTAAITVPNSKASITLSDILTTDSNASVNAIYDANPTTGASGVVSVSLTAGGATHVYIYARAENGTSCFYDITVTREEEDTT